MNITMFRLRENSYFNPVIRFMSQYLGEGYGKHVILVYTSFAL